MTLDELTDLGAQAAHHLQEIRIRGTRRRELKNSSTPRHSPRSRIGTANAAWKPSA